MVSNNLAWEPRRPPFWARETILYAAVLITGLLPHPDPSFNPSSPLTLALVIASLALLPLRLRWPWLALAGCFALFGTAAALGTTSPGIALAAAACVFKIALTTENRTALLTGLGSAVAIMALCLPAEGGSLLEPKVLFFGLAMLLAAAAGDGTRARRGHIAAITERAERAEQTREEEARRAVTEERLRIARDLHDAVAHQIAVISLNAGVASSALEKRPEKAKEALTTIRTASRTVLTEIGDLMNMLRAGEPHEEVACPQLGLAQFRDLAAEFRRSGLDLTLHEEGDVSRVSGATSLVAYRVLQEALTNAHKHGTGSADATIAVHERDATITVTNPIRGEEKVVPGTGLGLMGLRERVASVRGEGDVGPRDGVWTLTVRLPLSGQTVGSPREA